MNAKIQRLLFQLLTQAGYRVCKHTEYIIFTLQSSLIYIIQNMCIICIAWRTLENISAIVTLE